MHVLIRNDVHLLKSLTACWRGRQFRSVLLAALVTIARHDDALAQGPITNGQNHLGAISVAGETDAWTFTGNEGESYRMTMTDLGGSALFRPSLRLFAPNGALVKSTDRNVVAVLDGVLPQAGTYTIVAGDDGNNATGDYRLTLAHVPGAFIVPSGDQGGPMTNGGNHVGTIDLGDLDMWTFTGNAGEWFSLSVAEVGPNAPFSPWVRVVDPNGASLQAHSGSLVAYVDGVLAQTGTYTVIISTNDSLDTGAGDYLLTLAHVPGPFAVPPGDHGGPVTNGANHSGSIDRGDLDMWTFSANAGDWLSLSVAETAANGPFRPSIRLITPSGVLLNAVEAGLVAQLDRSLPNTGRYTIVVGSGDIARDEVGDYQLMLVRAPGPFIVPAGDHGGPMTSGVTYSGFIHLGDLDAWTFTTYQGASIVATMREIGGAGPFVPLMRLIAPNGAQIRTSTTQPVAEIRITAPQTGVYTIIAADALAVYENAYELRVDAPPVPLTLQMTTVGNGAVFSNPPGLSCGAQCTAGFALDTVVTFTPAAGANSVFAGWNGDEDCLDGVVRMDNAKTCSATFLARLPDYDQRSRRVLDLNGDGGGDVFRYNITTGAWSVDFADRQGRFNFKTGQWSADWGIKPADFNGDGLTDFFLYSRINGQWFKAINVGGGNFTYYQELGWSPGWDVTIADFNHDGKSDVFVYDSHDLGLWFRCISVGDGRGGFAYTRGQWPVGLTVTPLELNGDANPDLFVYNKSTGVWFKAINDAASGFTYQFGSWSPLWDLYPGDYNGDGKTDFLLYNIYDGVWFSALNDAAQPDGWRYARGQWSADWRMTPGDFDGDGRVDLYLYDPVAGNQFVCFSDGAGGWTYARMETISEAWTIAATDFNGDGRADIMFYNPVYGLYYQAITIGRGVFAYTGGSWGAGWTVIGAR